MIKIKNTEKFIYSSESQTIQDLNIFKVFKYLKFKISYYLLSNFLTFYLFFRYKSKSKMLKFDNSKLLIEFGGGHNPLKRKEGFLNVDLRALDTVDIVCSSNDIISKFQAKSVSGIFSRHFLEHLTEIELLSHLEDCKIILSEGGIIEAIVPSTEFHIIQLLCSQPGSTLGKHSFAGFNGWQRGQEIGYWDVHKSTFTYSSIKHLFNRKGFEVVFKKTSLKNIHFYAKIKRK